MRKFTIFSGPYILIRDATSKCKPFFKEYKDECLPKFEYDGRLLGCPFLKEYDGTKSKTTKKKGTKPGFCELCYDKYSNYQKHVISQTHIKSANETHLFREVDEIIESFKEGDFRIPALEMAPLSSPVGHKSPDHYNGPSNFLSFMSKKDESATIIKFTEKTSDVSPGRREALEYDNIDEFVRRIINDSD
ncbi:Protein DBF4 like protein B [Cucumispora dikerogammari]|nr:Protein DBF4 like protein B [Cucumispora dikerogammari]